ncbi:amidohydrolase, partial [bacterium]|nr:amidohydrolase [bacterium]
AQGVKTVSFSDNPALLGFPSIHADYWDPLWKACADTGLVISCHIGTGAHAEHASDLSPIDAWITSMPISIANSAADWIWAPMWS